MITCPNCLKKLENGTKVCDECGYDLLSTAQKRPTPIVESNDADDVKLGAESDAANEHRLPHSFWGRKLTEICESCAISALLK